MTFNNTCRFNAVSAGQLDFTVSSPVAGCLTPLQAGAVDQKVYYYLAKAVTVVNNVTFTQWEYGSGIYNAITHQLRRTTVTRVSHGDLTPVAFMSAPVVDVFPSPLPYLEVPNFASWDAQSFNNKILNGGMEIDQPNAGGAVALAGSTPCIDGWFVSKTGSMIGSIQQVSDAPPGFSNSLKLSIATAEPSLGPSDFAVISQSLEGFSTSDLQFGSSAALPVSIGFWAKIHRPGLYSGSIQNAGFTRSCPFSWVQNAADTWEYKTVVLPGDLTGTWLGNTTSVGLRIWFAMAAGSAVTGPASAWASGSQIGITGTTNGVAAVTDTFQLSGVSLVAGVTVPTPGQSPLLKRSLISELPRCKRQFCYTDFATDFNAGAGGQVAPPCVVTFQEEMRIVPTSSIAVTVSNANCALAGSGFVNSTTRSLTAQFISSAPGRAYYYGTMVSDARLIL